MGRRYLVITELLLPTKGGTAVWFDEVYRRLGGKDTHIVTADVPGAAAHDAGHPNSVHRIPLKRHWWLKPESAAMYAKLFFAALGIALRHELDTIHAGRALPEGLVGWAVARLARLPVVVYAHGEELTTWGRGAKYKAMRFTLRHADKVIANSDYTRDELLKMGVSAERIVRISPGVDINRFRPGLPYEDLRERLGLTEGQKLILSVGRLQRRKGFDQMIRALPALVKEGIDAHLAIIGIGDDHAYLEALADETGVKARVHLLGHVSPDDLPRWYNACDVFAMPNREIAGDTEGFGMVFLEAAACGKPAVAGIAGGTGAAVAHEVTGLRVDGAAPEAVSDALTRILRDASFAETLGARGHERATGEFAWEQVARKTLAEVG